MTPPDHPDFIQDPSGHKAACDAVLDTLQHQLNEGNIPEGGMLAAYVTIVETIKPDGDSGIYLLWSDGRTTVMSGLLTTGQMILAKNT